jgi:hypothetical protein
MKLSILILTALSMLLTACGSGPGMRVAVPAPGTPGWNPVAASRPLAGPAMGPVVRSTNHR